MKIYLLVVYNVLFFLLDSVDKLIEPPKDSMWEMLKKPKAEFVGCKCNWGLFRDRNVTMRKPIRIFSGITIYHVEKFCEIIFTKILVKLISRKILLLFLQEYQI